MPETGAVPHARCVHSGALEEVTQADGTTQRVLQNYDVLVFVGKRLKDMRVDTERASYNPPSPAFCALKLFQKGAVCVVVAVRGELGSRGASMQPCVLARIATAAPFPTPHPLRASAYFPWSPAILTPLSLAFAVQPPSNCSTNRCGI